MARRKPRGLRPGEKEIWENVAHGATPLHRSPKDVLIEAIESITPAPPPLKFPMFRVGENANPSFASGPRTQTAAVQMDSKKLGLIRKGKIAPEARTDLHGMTLAEAHPALIGFILNAHARGHRLVLVITGKGKMTPAPGPVAARKGVLKRQVPIWLSLAPLNGLVQQVTDAHARHGGGGALYVYLRRRR